MHRAWLLSHGFILVCIITRISIAILPPEDYRTEEDDIIKQAMSDDARMQTNGYFPQMNYNNYIADVSKRADTPLVEEAVTSKPSKGGKAEAENIVGDMKKYGLWEYTTDTTGMGEQIKEMMSKSQDTDTESPSSLLKHADKMNEEINKYAEQAPTMVPTIDPYDTPLGYTTPGITVESRQKPTAQPGIENVDVVTIPNQLTIEDEHGNNLDNLNKGAEKNEPTKSMTPIDINPTRAHSTPTPSATFHHNASPTTALTLKLLNALKGSKTFLQNAEKLLASPNDSEMVLYQKQKNLVKYLEAYEAEHSETKPKVVEKPKIEKPKVEKVVEKVAPKEEKPAADPRKERLLKLLHEWMLSGHPTAKVTFKPSVTNVKPSVTNVKPSVTNAVKVTDSKIPEDINLIQSPSGTADKPSVTETATTKPKEAKPPPEATKLNEKKALDLVNSLKTHGGGDSDKLQKELLESIFQMKDNENKVASPPPEDEPIKQFIHEKQPPQAVETVDHGKDEAPNGDSLAHHPVENIEDKSNEKTSTMLEQLEKMIIKEKEKEKYMDSRQKGELKKINDLKKLFEDDKEKNLDDIGNVHKAEDESGNDVGASKILFDDSDEKHKHNPKNEDDIKTKLADEEAEKAKEDNKIKLVSSQDTDEDKIKVVLMKEMEEKKLKKVAAKESEEKKLKEDKVERTPTTHDEEIGDKVYNYIKDTDEFKKLMAQHLKKLKDNTVKEKENKQVKEIGSEKPIAEKNEKNTQEESEKLKFEKEKEKEKSKEESNSMQMTEKVKHEHESDSEKNNNAEINESEKISPSILKQLKELKEEKERLRLKEEKLKRIEEEIAKNKELSAGNPRNYSSAEKPEEEETHKLYLASPSEPEQNISRAVSKYIESEVKSDKHIPSIEQPFVLPVDKDEASLHREQNEKLHHAVENRLHHLDETTPHHLDETDVHHLDEAALHRLDEATLHHLDETALHHLVDDKVEPSNENILHRSGVKSMHQSEESTLISPHSKLSENTISEKSTASNALEENTHLSDDSIRVIPHRTQKYISTIFSPESQSKMPSDKTDSKFEGNNNEESKVITKQDELVSTKENKSLKELNANSEDTTAEVSDKEHHLSKEHLEQTTSKNDNSGGNSDVNIVADNKETMYEGDLNQVDKVSSIESLQTKGAKTDDSYRNVVHKDMEKLFDKPTKTSIESQIRGIKSISFNMGDNDIHINSPLRSIDAKHVINKQNSEDSVGKSSIKSGLGVKEGGIPSSLKSLGSTVLKDLKLFQHAIDQKNPGEDISQLVERINSKKATTLKDTCNTDDTDELSHFTPKPKECEGKSKEKTDKTSSLPIRNPAPEEEFDDPSPSPKFRMNHSTKEVPIMLHPSISSSPAPKKTLFGVQTHKETDTAINKKLLPTTLAKELISLESLPNEIGTKRHIDMSKLLLKHSHAALLPATNSGVPSASWIKPSPTRFLDVKASKRRLSNKLRFYPTILGDHFQKLGLRKSILKYIMAKKRLGIPLTPRDALILFHSNTAHKMQQHIQQNITTDHNKTVPIPDPIPNRIIHVSNSTNDGESNVIIPGTSHVQVISGVDPGDITRSVLPKKIHNNVNSVNSSIIEDVFNILGSEDQITYRSNVTYPT